LIEVDLLAWRGGRGEDDKSDAANVAQARPEAIHEL
jgi:hypothetical protein